MYSEVSPFREETIKDELHTLSETIKKEQIQEKIQNNILDLSTSECREVREVLTRLLQDKKDYKKLKLIVLPETFIYESGSNLKLILDVLDTLGTIKVKTDKWYDIPRPPKRL